VTSLLRRLDHVAVAVRDTDTALQHFSERLGLRVASSEELEVPRVRLTYLDAGNAYIQLVEPLDGESELARWLDENGEGLHHICFGVDDVPDAIAQLSGETGPPRLASGRGRTSGFVPAPNGTGHGVRLECTEFVRAIDVEQTPGWLA
jgi:methylmalonyl-CoA epimerase